MNLYAVRAIYKFEMARTFRTLLQSVVSPPRYSVHIIVGGDRTTSMAERGLF